jgi:trk system potassium uptake protein TrkA
MQGVTVHVVIVGCGRVGSSLARQLEESGHTVAVVDRKSDAFQRLGPDFKGQTI